MNRLLSRSIWGGEVSLAILLRSATDLQLAEAMLLNASKSGPTLRWCGYRTPYYIDSGQLTELWRYPANIMRNRALQLVETEQVLLLDADFIPSKTVAAFAKEGVPDLQEHELLVLAPFQVDPTQTFAWQQLLSSGILDSKAQLISSVEAYAYSRANESANESAIIVGPFAPYLASIINYSRWWDQHQAEDYATPSSLWAEPYFIANTAAHLAFDERYVGYGNDKVEQMHRSGCAGRVLRVAHNGWVIHAAVGDSAQNHRGWGAKGDNAADLITSHNIKCARTPTRFESQSRHSPLCVGRTNAIIIGSCCLLLPLVACLLVSRNHNRTLPFDFLRGGQILAKSQQRTVRGPGQ